VTRTIDIEEPETAAQGEKVPKAIVAVNAGSSTLKFSIFHVRGSELELESHGEFDLRHASVRSPRGATALRSRTCHVVTARSWIMTPRSITWWGFCASGSGGTVSSGSENRVGEVNPNSSGRSDVFANRIILAAVLLCGSV